jgi:hypothetical protein
MPDKLIKVSFTYATDSGPVTRSLSGDDAEAWYLNQQATVAAAQSTGFDPDAGVSGLNWVDSE